MRRYLLPENGQFYKANLHAHSRVSDGGLTPAELKERYKANGYSILAYTDHELLVDHSDLTDPDFGKALREAAAAGVQILAMDCCVSPERMELRSPVELRL